MKRPKGQPWELCASLSGVYRWHTCKLIQCQLTTRVRSLVVPGTGTGTGTCTSMQVLVLVLVLESLVLLLVLVTKYLLPRRNLMLLRRCSVASSQPESKNTVVTDFTTLCV